MWVKLGRFILKYRIALILVLAAATAFMGYHASKVELSYEFTRAIPLDNPKYMEYQNFRAKFGEDGNLLVVGVQTEGFFKAGFFNGYASLVKQMKAIPAVEDVLNIPGAVNLVKDTAAEKLQVSTVFPQRELSQQELDSATATFGTLLF